MITFYSTLIKYQFIGLLIKYSIYVLTTYKGEAIRSASWFTSPSSLKGSTYINKIFGNYASLLSKIFTENFPVFSIQYSVFSIWFNGFRIKSGMTNSNRISFVFFAVFVPFVFQISGGLKPTLHHSPPPSTNHQPSIKSRQ